jgi:hypothetical protein
MYIYTLYILWLFNTLSNALLLIFVEICLLCTPFRVKVNPNQARCCRTSGSGSTTLELGKLVYENLPILVLH